MHHVNDGNTNQPSIEQNAKGATTNEKEAFFGLLQEFRDEARRLRTPPATTTHMAPDTQREASTDTKEHAYFMARSYLAMRTECPHAFAERLKFQDMSEVEWRTRWFAPLEAVDIGHQRLIEAVDRGMTLDDYLKSSSADQWLSQNPPTSAT